MGGLVKAVVKDLVISDKGIANLKELFENEWGEEVFVTLKGGVTIFRTEDEDDTPRVEVKP